MTISRGVHEKHRNQMIFELQGNRNPLIDFPECSDKINFNVGMNPLQKQESFS
jgi:hypothetical protein